MKRGREFKSRLDHHSVHPFLHFLENRSKSARMRAICDLRRDPENVSCGAIRRNQAKVIRARFC